MKRRSLFTAVFLLAALLPVQAAPTCLNQAGDTARCGTPGAMPVGWKPSPLQLLEWQRLKPPGPDADTLLEIALGIALLFALIALMPEFDGTRPQDWDRQEGDDDAKQ